MRWASSSRSGSSITSTGAGSSCCSGALMPCVCAVPPGWCDCQVSALQSRPLEEAYKPEHLPEDSSWRALACGNRHGCLPRAALNLHLDDMPIGLQSADGSPNRDRVSALPGEPTRGRPGPLEDTVCGGTIHPDDESSRPVRDRQRDRQIDPTDQPGRGAVLERKEGLTHTSHPGPCA